MSAASHMTSGNAPAATVQPTSVWRASVGGDTGGSKHYLFSQSVTFTSVASMSAERAEDSAHFAKADPFEAVVAKAEVTPEKLAKLFKRESEKGVRVALKGSPAAKKAKTEAVAKAKIEVAAKEKVEVALAEASQERFAVMAPVTPKAKKQTEILLAAYAPTERSSAADALHKLADVEAEDPSKIASLAEDVEDLGAAPVPTFRPDMTLKPGKRAVEADQALKSDDDEDIRIVTPSERPALKSDEKPVAKLMPMDKRPLAEKPELKEPSLKDKNRQRMAAVVPEETKKPSAGNGWSFRNLFTGGGRSIGGGARAGKGVAVYDISAARVYMPDGTVLKAASGIGKMANNPKYAHVKMNGPTPPHTYNLRMREKRFHGVEAIRMLPVDGKNKYGRDGFLTHTQLLRGRPGQSHGCVAFEDYNKFLNAYKQGKVKQMVVVASGGRAAAGSLMARN